MRLLFQVCVQIILIISASLSLDAADPATVPRTIQFSTDIHPLLQTKCVACHNQDLQMGDLLLTSRDAILLGGKSGPAVVVGQSGKSLLIDLVSGKDPQRYMPLSGDKLAESEIDLLRRWIDQGLVWDTGTTASSQSRSRDDKLTHTQPPLPEPHLRPDLENPIDLLLQDHFRDNGIDLERLVDDRLFVRRAYLDVIGLLPTYYEIQQFVHQTDPKKRENLIDRLLSKNKEFAEHWMSTWNDWLRNAYRGTGFIDDGRKQITKWLYRSLRENKPYNQFVSELIDPVTDSIGFSKGIIWRGVVNASQTPEMQAAQNVSQVFLGINLKCASCHDSFINQWKLKDAYGLASVFAEKPLELVRCDNPTGEMAEVKFLYPQLGSILPDGDQAERRKQLAELMTCQDNGRFAKTIVNRLWAQFMGHGLVEPLDDMDAPAWNRDVLDWLAYDLAENDYNLKRTMRWILHSKAYQLPAVDRVHDPKEYVFRGPLARRMTAEQFVDAISQITSTPMLIPHYFFSKDGRGQDGQGEHTILMESKQLLAFSSDIVKDGTVTVQANIDGARTIHLVATDNLDGSPSKTITWIAPRLSRGSKQFPLTPESLFTISTANGEPPLFEICHADNERTSYSITVTSSSVLTFKTPPGYDRFECEVQIPESQPLYQDGIRAVAPNYQIHLLTGDLDIRAVHLHLDSLQKALGRTNREQVVTRRESEATTLQALELSNGETLYRMIRLGAGNLLRNWHKTDMELISEIFVHALGRKPSQPELDLARSLLVDNNKQEGLEDILWIVSMLPEFQLIY